MEYLHLYVSCIIFHTGALDTGGRGWHWHWKVVYMYGPKDPISPFCHSQKWRLPFEASISSQDPAVEGSPAFYSPSLVTDNIFHSNIKKLAKIWQFSYQKIKFGSSFGLHAWKFCKISVPKTPTSQQKWAPKLRTSGLHIPSQKSWVPHPPGMDDTSMP